MPGLHDFDFFVGYWQVRHQQLRQRLAGSEEWIEFAGTAVAQPLMGGYGNFDDNVLELPSGTYHAVTLRAFDAKTKQWSIWWLDGRTPLDPLDPPGASIFERPRSALGNELDHGIPALRLKSRRAMRYSIKMARKSLTFVNVGPVIMESSSAVNRVCESLLSSMSLGLSPNPMARVSESGLM